MTENEAMKAMRQQKKVRLVNSGKEYIGELVARYGDGTSFLFQGKTERGETKRGETIRYLGKPEEFALVQGRK